MNARDQNGEPPLKRRRTVENFYHEDIDIKKMNPFRVAELRVKNNIFVSRETVDTEEDKIPNPLKQTVQAFKKYPAIVEMLRKSQMRFPRPLQSQGWPVILRGDDVICISGDNPRTGKRLTYLLPAIVRIQETSDHEEPIVVCLSPTPLQIKEEIEKFEFENFKCECLQDDTEGEPIKGCKIIAATPEQLNVVIEAGDLKLSSISYVVLEKADEMLNMNFKPQIDRILSGIQKSRQIIITSTTWCKSVQELASSYCVNPVIVAVGSLDLSTVRSVTQQFQVAREEKEKLQKVIEYLRSMAPEEKVAVFCADESTIDDICGRLDNEEIPYRYYPCGKIARDIETSDDRIFVTNYAARDFKVEGITQKYYFNFPQKIEEYVDRIRETYEGGDATIKLISLLSINDRAIAPDLIAVLRRMEQVVPAVLYDLANGFKTVVFLENPHFLEIAETDYFVDKSMMIKTIIDWSDNYLICAPRKFGKSTNLKMLDYFFNVTTREKSENVFKRLKIGQYPDILSEHRGQYAVIWVDCSNASMLDENEETWYDSMRAVVHFAYKKYRCLFEHLPKENLMKRWSGDSYSTIDKRLISTALYKLAEFLHNHYQKKVILMCDEFDNIWDGALEKNIDADTLNLIIRTYYEMFLDLAKTDDLKIIYKTIFCGVTCAETSPLDTLKKDSFLESPRFAHYYGIRKIEFEELLDKPLFEKLRYEKEDAMALYNGYQFENDCDILNTYSVVSYFSAVSDDSSCRLNPYWQTSGSIGRYMKVWEAEAMQPVLQRILRGESFSVPKYEKFTARDLAALNEICKEQNFTMNSLHIFYAYLQQFGYFTIVKSDRDSMCLRIPNDEIRKEFGDRFALFYLLKYHIPERCLNDCARYFIQLNNTERIEETLEKIRLTISESCKNQPKHEEKLEINEASVQHFVFAALVLAKYSSPSPTKKLDLCFYRNNFGGVIELKFGSKENAKKALLQIQENEYYKIFDEQIPGKIEKTLFIGIHVNEEGLVTSRAARTRKICSRSQFFRSQNQKKSYVRSFVRSS